jgi:hypothetical protein
MAAFPSIAQQGKSVHLPLAEFWEKVTPLAATRYNKGNHNIHMAAAGD